MSGLRDQPGLNVHLPDAVVCYITCMSNDVVPMMSYRNSVEALDWLIAAFGFTEFVRMVNDDGRLEHAELGVGSRDHHARDAESRLRGTGAPP